ncbi:MAG: PAS domain S-box protein, partial [Chitinophagaceae bacterium]
MQSFSPGILSTFNKSKDSYRIMLDALPAMVYYLDKDYRYMYANVKYREWLGLEAAALIGKGLDTIFEKATYDCLKRYSDQAMGGETIHFETDVHIQTSVDPVSIEATLIPDWDDQDRIKGYLALIQDVTDKKREQKKLESKNKELEDYVDHAAIGLHWVDSSGVILWANKAELDMLGYKPDEYIGHPITEFHVDQKKIGILLSRLGNNETLNQYESELRCKDGSTRTVHISSNVLWEEGKFIHTRCFTVDVTEQKNLFEALKDSEQKYRDLSADLENKIVERTKDIERKNDELRKNEERYQRMIGEVEDYAILLIDLDGIVQNWNKGAEKIKGYSEQEIIGKSFKLFYLPEDQASGLPEKLIGEATIQGKALQEGWRRRKNGTAFWGSVLITALHNDKGQIVGFTKVTRDLTERKLAEEKLSKYAQELEFQNKELEQFAYAASHDMKEPLRKIIFYNSFISEGAGNQLPEKERTFLGRSIGAASRL